MDQIATARFPSFLVSSLARSSPRSLDERLQLRQRVGRQCSLSARARWCFSCAALRFHACGRFSRLCSCRSASGRSRRAPPVPRVRTSVHESSGGGRRGRALWSRCRRRPWRECNCNHAVLQPSSRSRSWRRNCLSSPLACSIGGLCCLHLLRSSLRVVSCVRGHAVVCPRVGSVCPYVSRLEIERGFAACVRVSWQGGVC